MIIERKDLGRPLTWDELDSNFQQVDGLVQQSAAAVSEATAAASSASQSASDAQEAAQSVYGDLASTEAGKGASLVKLQNDETMQSKAQRYIDASDGGALGDGVNDDSVLFRNVELYSNPLFIPQNKNYNIGSNLNQSDLWGPGTVTINSVQFTNLSPHYDLKSDSLFFHPESYYSNFGDYPGSNGKSNIILSPGSKPRGKTNRCTVIGTNNLTKAINIDRTEAFGNCVFQFMRYGERNTGVGSIVGQWLGTNDPEGDGHELWSNAGGFKPGQPGWDYGGLETANPGIGAKIAAFTAYATTPAECSRNVGVGRDAFNGSIKLMNCTAVGYRASASLINGSNNAAFGTDANRSGIFTSNSTWIGVAAGNSWQEGTRNSVFGYNAGSQAITGDFNTMLGSYAGYNFKTMNNCIFIGHGAGNNIFSENESPDNILAIGNNVSGIASPLISGDMAAPKVGINIMPSKIAGTLHVRTISQSETPPTPSGAADDFIIENASNTGMTIRSGETGLGTVVFSSPTTASVAGMIYNHSTSTLTLRSATGDRWSITSNAITPATDNSYSVGTAALRPSQIFAGTGTINTSDERLKTRLDIEEAEKAAALEIKANLWKYQFNDSNLVKQDGGRYHFGVGAQSVGDILRKHGLDPEKYAFYCYDEWEDQYEAVFATRTVERDIQKVVIDDKTSAISTQITRTTVEEEYDTGEKRLVLAAGNRYGVRYEELLCFIMIAL